MTAFFLFFFFADLFIATQAI